MSSSVPSRPVHIYALLDPRDCSTRYIGKTTDPARRLREHMTGAALRRESHCARWLRGLRDQRLGPLLIVLETASATSWIEAEQRQIAFHRAIGCRLTNLTAGGEGHAGLTKSAATRAKIGASQRGKIISKEAIAAMQRSLTGRALSPEHRAKVSAALRLRPPLTSEQRSARAERMRGTKRAPFSLEWRRHLSEAQRGRTHTPETRAKISAGQRGKKRGPLTAEHRAILSERGKGRVLTPEERHKVSVKRKAQWAAMTPQERRAHMEPARRARQARVRSAAHDGRPAGDHA